MHNAVFPDIGQQAFWSDHRPTKGIAVSVNIFSGAVNDDIGPKR